MNLAVLHSVLAVCRLDPAGGLPAWFTLDPPLAAAVVRDGELTIVARQESVPDGVVAERGWRGLEVAGPLDLTMTGVMAALSGVLADAEIPLFAVSSFDTDVLLVREAHLDRAVDALRAAGHAVAN